MEQRTTKQILEAAAEYRDAVILVSDFVRNLLGSKGVSISPKDVEVSLRNAIHTIDKFNNATVELEVMENHKDKKWN